jgi:hypothetical protein
MLEKMAMVLLCLTLFVAQACTPRATRKLLVVDAETQAPIAQATLDLHPYPSSPEAADPRHPQAESDQHGELTIPRSETPAIWQVQAEGYIEQRLTGSAGEIPPRMAATATAPYAGRIYLYRLPEPQLTIWVRDHYTGPLTINLQPAVGFGFVQVDGMNTDFVALQPDAKYVQDVVGQRVFSATASADGVVTLVVTPLLYDITTAQLQIRDSNGVIPYSDATSTQKTERVIWGDVNEESKRLQHQIPLFVGTLADYQRFRGFTK